MAFFPLLPVDFDTELQRMDQTIQQFERMFGNISPSKALSASRFGKQLMSLQAPNIDMSENDKEVIIKADLPGLEGHSTGSLLFPLQLRRRKSKRHPRMVSLP